MNFQKWQKKKKKQIDFKPTALMFLFKSVLVDI